MAIFEGMMHLLDALDFATSSSWWRFLVPAVLGGAAGLFLYHSGGGTSGSVFAGSSALLAGVVIGAVWQYRWRSSRRRVGA